MPIAASWTETGLKPVNKPTVRTNHNRSVFMNGPPSHDSTHSVSYSVQATTPGLSNHRDWALSSALESQSESQGTIDSDAAVAADNDDDDNDYTLVDGRKRRRNKSKLLQKEHGDHVNRADRAERADHAHDSAVLSTSRDKNHPTGRSAVAAAVAATATDGSVHSTDRIKQSTKTFAAAVAVDRLNQNHEKFKSKPTNRKPIMVGTRRSPIVSGSAASNMSAAKPLLGKAFFCVDNVGVDMTELDMERFVKRMRVRVLSCHKTNPRRTFYERRQKIKPEDRRAFRLCINRADTDLLMNPDNWPADIAISAWYFKPKKSDDSAAAEEVTAAAAAAAVDEATEMPATEPAVEAVEADAAVTAAEILEPETEFANEELATGEHFDDANMSLSPTVEADVNAGADATMLYDHTEAAADSK